MKKGYKKCPYCANEIKEEAIKCQYCEEFLNKTERKEEYENPQGTAWYKNKIVRIISAILVVVILIVLFYNSERRKQAKTDYLINKTEERSKSVKSYKEIKKELDVIESRNEEEEKFKQEAGELIENFGSKIDSIDEDALYPEISDYQNEELLKRAINAWKTYTEYYTEYADATSALVKKYKHVDDTGNGKYSLTNLTKEIDKTAISLRTTADKCIEYYNYLLSIQDEFYIDYDEEQVYFYKEGVAMNRYNQLSSELYNVIMQFLEDYNNYWEYMDKYNKYHGLN